MKGSRNGSDACRSSKAQSLEMLAVLTFDKVIVRA
jgi:hypothetical protein